MTTITRDLTAATPRAAGGGLSTRVFRRNLLSNAGGNLANTALQFGLLAILFQLQSTADFAAMMTATALVGVCEMASDYGARLWATREFSYSRQPRRVLQHSVACKLFYTTVCTTLLLVIPAQNLTVGHLLFCVLIAASQPSSDPFLWYLRGRERLDIEAGVVFAFRTAGVIGMGVCAVFGQPVAVLLLVWLASNCFRILLELRLRAVVQIFETQTRSATPPLTSTSLRTSAGDGGPDRTEVSGSDVIESIAASRTMTTSGVTRPDQVAVSTTHPELTVSAAAVFGTISAVFPVGTTFFLTSLFQRIGILLLSVLATDADVQVFGTAFRVVSTAGFLSTSMFVSSFAALSRAIHADDRQGVRKIVRSEMHLVTAVFLPICLMGIVVAIPLSHLFRNPTIVDIARIMVILLPGLYLSCVNMGLKYVVNAWSLNWLDILAVVTGIAVFAGLTVFPGRLSWSVAPALGWGLGEGAILVSRLLILKRAGKQAGFPLGLVLGATVVLTAVAWVTVT